MGVGDAVCRMRMVRQTIHQRALKRLSLLTGDIHDQAEIRGKKLFQFSGQFGHAVGGRNALTARSKSASTFSDMMQSLTEVPPRVRGVLLYSGYSSASMTTLPLIRISACPILPLAGSINRRRSEAPKAAL